ncbi:hypothetical protein D1013_01805 [Euzebyella marina]|uniref:Uncharacterized protein n=1 Tax=Euzebyella marina TaxID=1761453 RepID=A0A3G2L1R1_9FLAO|nr:hypothetical protein [Euzebyella marina]AYN66204.1 hypothetical protein D1013_01805 [Euzebyella marina]
MRTKIILSTFLFWSALTAFAQEIPVNYQLGENYSDRYKYSTVLSIESSTAGETVLVRTYYGGFPLRPKGYFIEVYDENLNLKVDFNYKHSGAHMVDGFVKNGQLYLLELTYDIDAEAYTYMVHQTPLSDFYFTERKLLSVPSKEVINPLAVNKYNRNFGNGFSTATHFNDERSAFAITVHYREGRDQKYKILLYGTDLNKRLEYDFTQAIEEKNYAFENIEVSKDLSSLYMMGKAYFKKRRSDLKERRFQYELVKVSAAGHTVQEFTDAGRFPESLKPILVDNELKVVGFYADRKDNRYNGLVYFNLDKGSLNISSKQYNPFSEQFMIDKFGREVDAEIKNLIFKSVHITPEKNILFSAEEYFVTKGEDISSGGTQITERYHYNDIVLAKLDANGKMLWARNINKAEVTQGDASYASYTAYGHGEDMYFFINSGENPQKISKERILFKQGFSRNPNMFVIKVDASGDLSYKKLVDDKEVRLPIMVSRPLINNGTDTLLFYAKRGSKKQMVQVTVN